MAEELRILTTDDLSGIDAQFEGIAESINDLDSRLSEYVNGNTGSTDILNYITYEITTNDRGFKEATITGCDASIKGVYELPSGIEGASVKVIGANAFDECEGLLGLLIPSTVTTIGDSAFRNSGLRFFYMPDSVKTLGGAVFYYAPLHYIRFSNSITSIPSGFCGRSEELTEIIWPKSLTSIGSNAFTFLKLDTLYIPSGVTTLSGSAFWEGEFKNIYIPKSLKQLSGAFGYCNDVTDIYYEGTQSEFINTFNNQSVTQSIANATRHYGVSYAAGEDKINIKIDRMFDRFKSEVSTLTSSTLTRTVVYSLPSDANSVDLNTIYMIPNSSDNKINIYDEYLFIAEPGKDVFTHEGLNDAALKIIEVYINDERVTELPFTLSDGAMFDDIQFYSTSGTCGLDPNTMSHVITLPNAVREAYDLKLVIPLGAEGSIITSVIEGTYDWVRSSTPFFIQGQISELSVDGVSGGDLGVYTTLITKELIGSSECDLDGFVTKSEHNDLVNRVNNLGSTLLKRVVLDKLPSVHTLNDSTIYMVGPKPDGTYDEYMVLHGDGQNLPDEIQISVYDQASFTAYDSNGEVFAADNTYYTRYVCSQVEYDSLSRLKLVFSNISDDSYFELLFSNGGSTGENYQTFKTFKDNQYAFYVYLAEAQGNAGYPVNLQIGVTSVSRLEQIGSTSVDLSEYVKTDAHKSLVDKVNGLISTAVTRQVCESLPSDEDLQLNVIYMIPQSGVIDSDTIYDEYLAVTYSNVIESTVPANVYNLDGTPINIESNSAIYEGYQTNITEVGFIEDNVDILSYKIVFSDFYAIVQNDDSSNLRQNIELIYSILNKGLSVSANVIYSGEDLTVSVNMPMTKPERIGSTEIDLSGYVAKSEYDSTIAQLNSTITDLTNRLAALEETAATIADYSDEIENNQ